MYRHFALAAVAAALVASAGTAAPAPDGKNRKVLIQNDSSQTINELYASPSTNKTWEENLLAQRQLPPGQSVRANIDNGTNECIYDLKLVFASAKAIEQRGVNVCAIGRWLVTDAGNSLDSGGQAVSQTPPAPTPAVTNLKTANPGVIDPAAANLKTANPTASHSMAGRPAMVRAQDPQTLMDALQAKGYPAQLGADRVGDPMITSAVGATSFQIFFYNCKDHRECATVQFHSGYNLADNSVPLSSIDEWNRTRRFTRAHLDKETDPILEMDVDLDDGGVTPSLFMDNIEYWASALPQFESLIGFRR